METPGGTTRFATTTVRAVAAQAMRLPANARALPPQDPMALSTQGWQGRDRLPRDIRAPGPLRNDAVVGRILFLESRSLGSADTTGQGAASQEGAASQVGAGGTGKGKKGSGKGKKGKGARSDAVLEITLCGGKSPADVMMFQAW